MIGFLHPWVLAGLAAAAIPVLLHLLARREPPTVIFPAVRYLITTTREHQRRLKLHNLLLLLARTLLIAALVLAAAGPTKAMRGVPGHAPSALVLILDNSPSSSVVVAGSERLGQLRAAAQAVLRRATADDRVWLLTADGAPRRGDHASLGQQVATLTSSSRRLDLGGAIRLAGDVLASDSRPGEIVLLSDLQATSVSPAAPTVPLVVGRPKNAPPPNNGIIGLTTGSQPWSSDGGRVAITLGGDSGSSIPVTGRLGQRPPRQTLGHVGSATTLALPGVPGGWWPVTVELDPDELRLDDRRVGVVRVAPVARVRWDSASRYIAAACEVLLSNRRIARGDEVTIGRLTQGGSIIQPPKDPAELGALNRALAGRGVGWSYSALSVTPATTDSGAVVGRERIFRRYQLQPSGSGRTGVLATVAGTPWLVRSGNVLLLGSRLDPDWTELPVSPGFMPFMDGLLNRLARGEVTLTEGSPGDEAILPDLVTAVRQGERAWPVEGGGRFRPPETGVYFLVAEGDTVGALSTNLDPRESFLAPATDAEVRQLWKGAELMPLEEVGDAAFSAGARGDLRGPLLWSAFLLGMIELGLASAWRRER